MNRMVQYILALVLLTAACEQKQTLSPDALAPVKVGIIASLSGGLRDLGPGWVNAAALAANEVNAGGGVLPGRLVEVFIADDETDPDAAEDAAIHLIEEEQVVGIVGGTGSSMALRIDDIAGPAKVPQLSGTATSPALNAVDDNGIDANPFFFRTVPSDDLQGWVLATLAYGELNNEEVNLECRQMVLMHLDDDYGRPLADRIQKRFADELGGTIVAAIPIEDGAPNYVVEVNDAIEAAPDCIALVAYPESGGTIVRDWDRQGGSEEVHWIGTEGIRGSGFGEELEELEVRVIGTAAASDPSRAELEVFSSHYWATFVEEPATLGEAVYDSMALLLLAIAFAGSTEGEALQGALIEVARRKENERTYGPGALVNALQRIADGNGIDYEGAVGSADLEPNGDVVTDFEVWEFEDGEYRTVMTVLSSSITIGGGGQ